MMNKRKIKMASTHRNTFAEGFSMGLTAFLEVVHKNPHLSANEIAFFLRETKEGRIFWTDLKRTYLYCQYKLPRLTLNTLRRKGKFQPCKHCSKSAVFLIGDWCDTCNSIFETEFSMNIVIKKEVE